MTESAVHVRVIEETPAYWRVVFDYPPFNIVDATIFTSSLDHTTDYATVLLPLPGISNDLEVVRLL